ncbi:MAG: hypothetical protein IIT84_06180, partial [Oscillospiraceae bacterium]|nr:hypothetical protein [Oscillospiraceae bacterium]
MSGDPLELSLLFDFFGDLLTETQREYFDLYYNDDMSLAEVAELKGVSRPAVLDAVKKAKSYMQNFEEKTGVVKRFTEMRSGLLSLKKKLNIHGMRSVAARRYYDDAVAKLQADPSYRFQLRRELMQRWDAD